MDMKHRAKFRTEEGVPGVSTSESLSPLDTAGKGGGKRMDRMGNGQEKGGRQAGEEGLAVTRLLFRWHELKKDK